MARSLNKHSIIGNIGQEPEMRYLDSGASVVSFSVATDESYKDRDGNLVERTAWHRVTAWNKLAEIIDTYATRGMKVYVEGPVMEDTYTDKDGNERKSRYIKAQEFLMLSSKEDGGQRQLQPAGPAQERLPAGRRGRDAR